jgi:hypothetical protein
LPFRESTLSLRDILDGIDMIAQFVRGMDLEAFREDPKTVAAVERKLLLISEAAIRLGQEAERFMTGSTSKRFGTRSSTTFRRLGLGCCARSRRLQQTPRSRHRSEMNPDLSTSNPARGPKRLRGSNQQRA